LQLEDSRKEKFSNATHNRQVNAVGTRSNGFLDATRIEIIAQAP